ncbi:MAG: PGF-pre-PGF domain-containing protein [Nanoarchaeota archaeon]|nr:PGF-pre-PGF domain-containing protein [Nanoarchaeota archaeon]MBU4300063.1 PGF-pre-PGF domain-containing protein [Nanoarchaeota archaeon]MBU4451864.1 PGF-pre-PGF domain-containing protein [Nanoarchaeota archaeon]MCG2724400.1 PGF-pre-PGF domain-containing protein [archaeon]
MGRSKRDNGSSIILLAALIIIAVSSVSFTSGEFVAPTIPDNATTNINWTYINVSSNDALNQSLLEWGNSSGFTNISMLNDSLTAWYYNMTDLADGTYNYTIWTENMTGEWNQSAQRFVIVDTVAPYSLYACQDLTIENDSYVLAQNVSSAGTCFTISANNITLDGAGYTINYSQSETGYGVDNSGYNFTTIKNANIIQGATNNIAFAIYFNRSSNGIIQNSTITTSGQYSYGIFLESFSSSNEISNNTILLLGNASLGITSVTNSNSNTFLNNTIITSGVNSYGIALGASSNTIRNNTIKTTGTASYGIVLDSSTNSTIIGNVLNTTNTYAIYIVPSTNTSYYDHTIDTTNTEQGEPIYYYFANSSIVIENLTNVGQLYITNSTNITIRNVTIYKDGIIFAMTTNSSILNSNITAFEKHSQGILLYSSSNSNNISNNRITTFGDSGLGVRLISSSNSNTISNNNITASSNGIILDNSDINLFLSNNIAVTEDLGIGISIVYSDGNTLLNNSISAFGNEGIGIYFWSSSNSNAISGGSIMSMNSYDYFLSFTSTNNFTNTNFTTSRQIYFADTSSYFNYNNDSTKNIWLKTNVSAQSSINRTLVNWNNALMQWNDTNSTAGIVANYIITGLQATSIYIIYNASAGVQKNPYNKTTDASGNLPPFKIALKGNTEIKAVYYGHYVAPVPAPTCSDNIQNGDETGTDCGGSCDACSSDGGGGGDVITDFIRSTPSNNPVTKVEIYLKSSMTNPAVSVTKKQSVSFAAPPNKVYQYLEISKNNFNNSDIDEALIEFTVNKSWIVSNNITSIYLSRYDNGWIALNTQLVNSTEKYTTYSAQTPGFSYFAIIGKAVQTPKTPEQILEPPEENSADDAENTSLDSTNDNIDTPYSNTAANEPDTTIPSGTTSYGWIIALITVASIFIAVAFYFIDRKNKKKNQQKIEMAKQPQQKLIDPKMASAYINSRKKVFEEAETEYLIERLKEAKKLTQ